MKKTSVLHLWRNPAACQGFGSGVSLHSHTNQSRETLKFLAMLGIGLPSLIAALILTPILYQSVRPSLIRRGTIEARRARLA